MEVCNKEFIDVIINGLIESPDSQVACEVKEDLKKINNSVTYAEKYDIIVNISNMSSTIVSSFVKELCSLDKYYIKPKINLVD